MWWCVGGVNLTSTSYVYSRLVGHSPGWVVADAAIHSSIGHLGLANVEVTDHMALGVSVVGNAVAAVPNHRLIIQGPCHPGLWGSLHRARQGHKLIDVVDLFAEWSQDLGGAIWKWEETQVAMWILWSTLMLSILVIVKPLTEYFSRNRTTV